MVKRHLAHLVERSLILVREASSNLAMSPNSPISKKGNPNMSKQTSQEPSSFTSPEGVLTKLQLELACRPDNIYVGSGLGGNYSELLFLLTHPVVAVESETSSPFFVGTEKIQFHVHIPYGFDMKEIRRELTKFIQSHPDKLEVTNQQFLNPSFLRDLRRKTVGVQLLIRALEEGIELARCLDSKNAMYDTISKFFEPEYQEVRSAFLAEMKLPQSHFKDFESKISSIDEGDEVMDFEDSVQEMMENHPTWGVKYKAIAKRYAEMRKLLFSQTELDKLEFLGTFPPAITLVVVRECLTLERVVKFDLDDLCSFFERFRLINQ